MRHPHLHPQEHRDLVAEFEQRLIIVLPDFGIPLLLPYYLADSR